MTLHFRAGHTSDAEELIKRHHYSKRMAGNVQFVFTWHRPGGLFGDYGECVAAATFSIPGTRWAVPVLELSRLVRTPCMDVQLTKFLSLACGHLRRMKQPLIVSFADATQNHHGGIYQAASWNFSAYREPRQDGLLVDGVFVPGRSCNSRWGTRSPTLLSDRLGGSHSVAPHMDKGKYLYWKALNRTGETNAKKLELGRLPYAKPDLFIEPPKPKAEQTSFDLEVPA